MSENARLRGGKLLSLWLIILSCAAGNIFAQQNGNAEEKKLPPAHYVRSHDYDMRHIALSLKFDWDKEQALGTAAMTLAPLVPNFKTVNLDAGLMIINSVKLDSKNLTFNYDEANTLLSINLDRVYTIGEPLTLIVDYHTNGEIVPNTLGFGGGGGLKFIKPPAGDSHGRRQIWSQGQTDYNRFWFPSYDSPNDFASTELTATVEKPLFVVSNGALVNRHDNGDGTETFHWKMDTPHANYLTSVVVGEYAEVKGEYAGISVSSYVFPNELKEGQVSLKNLPAMVKFFSEKLGVKYAYPKYAQTTATGFSGGMENISATTMTPTIVRDAREMLDGDSDSIQSHELAHQWFGDYVTCREWGEIWLNESFATYFEALWMEESKGHDYFLYNDVRGNQQQYLAAWNEGLRRPIVTKNYTNKDAVFDAYAYPTGGAVLHMLRKHLGDELFFKSLNHYLLSNAHQPVQTEQLRIAIEQTTGQSMDWFFDEWLHKMGHPLFEISDNYDDAAKKLTLNVKQTQKIDPNNAYPQTEFFQTFVDIEIDNQIKRVWIEPKAENIFTFDVASRPKLINFDYESPLIKELKFEKPTDELVYQLQNDKDVLGRLWAMNELSAREKTDDAEKSKITAALNQTVTKDTFWAVRRDAIRLLVTTAATGSRKRNQQIIEGPNLEPATLNALTTAAKDTNSLVRAAAIEVLGALNDPQKADIYLAALNDQSYGVIDAASIALANTKDARSYNALVKLVNTDSWKDHVRLAGLQGLAVLGDKRAVDLGFKYADKSYPANVQNVALGMLAASGKGDARIYPLLMNNFKTALKNKDFQGIFGGLQNFIKLGDPRGQEAFDLAKAQFKDQQNFLAFVSRIEAEFKTAAAK